MVLQIFFQTILKIRVGNPEQNITNPALTNQVGPYLHHANIVSRSASIHSIHSETMPTDFRMFGIFSQ